MNIESLHLFTEVARLGSFAAVARTLNIDPSAVSRSIASLENELGVRLFQRTTRHMVLTQAGKTYLSHLAPILEELKVAKDRALEISSQPAGRFRLSASVAFGETMLVPLLADLQHCFPKIEIELLLSDNILDLVASQIDVSIRLTPNVQEDVVCTKLFETSYIVCASPSYISTHAPIIAPECLASHNILFYVLPSYRSDWSFRKDQKEIQDIPLKGNLVISNALSLKSAMLSGLGIALLPNWLIRESLQKGDCVNLLPSYQVAPTSFDTAAWLLYPSKNFLPLKSRIMIDFLKQHLTQ